MAWDIAAYAVVILCAAVTIAILYVTAFVRSTLNRWNAAAERLDREAEATLAEWRQLAQEATETASLCRRFLQGAESLAEGGRAIGEAAQTAGRTLASITHAWSERIAYHLASSAERQEQQIGQALDWSEFGWSLWQSLRNRAAPGNNDSTRQTPGTNADDDRRMR